MQVINTILWDLDGTLIDSERIHTEATLNVCDVLAPKSKSKIQQLDIPDGVENLHVYNLLFKDVQDGKGDSIKQNDSVDYHVWNQAVVEYAADHLHYAYKVSQSTNLFEKFYHLGLMQFIVSNSDSRIVERSIEVLGLKLYCHGYVSRDMVKLGKPDPELYLLALNKYNLNPKNCLVFEDSSAGVSAAKMAGLSVAAIDRYGSGGGLFQIEPDLICSINKKEWFSLLIKNFKFEAF